MRIVIYNNLDELFESFVKNLSELLRKKGHFCETITLRRNFSMAVPTIDNIDLEIFIAGYTILKMLLKYPRDKKIKRVVWVFEPLTDSLLAIHHSFKSDIFKQAESQFHGVLAMDNLVADYIGNHFPKKKCIVVPFPLSVKNIKEPLPEEEKDIEVLWLARLTKNHRRSEAKDYLLKSGVNMKHVGGGLKGRDQEYTIQKAQISLEIHSDDYHYFNQCRIFNAWANGSVVVAEPCINSEEYRVVNGKHLIQAKLSDFPTVIHELSGDSKIRREITSAAQDLLKEYTMENRINQIEEFLTECLNG